MVKILTLEHREKISVSLKGKKRPAFSEEWCKNISKGNKGRILSSKSRAKIRNALLGRKRPPFSKEWREKISKATKGRTSWLKGLTKETDERVRKLAEDPERRKKIGNAQRGEKNFFYGKDMSGENNPSWKGGISFEPYGIEFNDELKNKIRNRDNFICQTCGKKQNGRAHDVHHIDYNKKNNDPSNLITLCHSCHMKTNSNREDSMNYYQEKNLFIGELS